MGSKCTYRNSFLKNKNICLIIHPKNLRSLSTAISQSIQQTMCQMKKAIPLFQTFLSFHKNEDRVEWAFSIEM